MTFFGWNCTRLRAYLCLMIPPNFGTCLAIYSEMPTSVSIRRMIEPLSSCKGGAVPRREWLGGRIVASDATLASEGAIDKVTEDSGADFDSSTMSSTFRRFDGGASVGLSKDSQPRELDEVECISDKLAPGRCAGVFFASKWSGKQYGGLSQHVRQPRKKTYKSCCEGPPRNG